MKIFNFTDFLTVIIVLAACLNAVSETNTIGVDSTKSDHVEKDGKSEMNIDTTKEELIEDKSIQPKVQELDLDSTSVDRNKSKNSDLSVEIIVFIITVIVALYGAVLSTINLVRQNRLNKRDIKVIMSVGLMDQAIYGMKNVLIMEAQNVGFRTVTLTSHKIVLPDDYTYQSFQSNSTKTMPYRLTEADSIDFYFDIHQMANDLINKGYNGIIDIIASVSDGAGNRYTSKSFKFDLNEWKKN